MKFTENAIFHPTQVFLPLQMKDVAVTKAVVAAAVTVVVTEDPAEAIVENVQQNKSLRYKFRKGLTNTF